MRKRRCYRSSDATISQSTSCRVRSLGPRLDTRSSSAASLHDVTLNISEGKPVVLPPALYGVPLRTELGYGDGAPRLFGPGNFTAELPARPCDPETRAVLDELAPPVEVDPLASDGWCCAANLEAGVFNETVLAFSCLPRAENPCG